jgi:ankyrin repeat protein
MGCGASTKVKLLPPPPLIDAVSKNDGALVKELLSTSPDDINIVSPEFCYYGGQTPLVVASSLGFSDIVKVLLETAGIEVNKASIGPPPAGLPPLLLAARGGSDRLSLCPPRGVDFEKTVELLLATPGIDVNIQHAETGITALTLAAKLGDVGILRALLAVEGIDVNLQGNEIADGHNALHAACLTGHEKCTELLLEVKDIDVNRAASPSSVTPLMAAILQSDAMMKMLLEHPNIQVNHRCKDGSCALWTAAQAGLEDKVKMLLAKEGIDVNQPGPPADFGMTPLRETCQNPVKNGHENCFKQLLAMPGIDVNLGDTEDGFGPLTSAATYGRTSMVKVLLATKGVDVNQKSKNGATPLDAAGQRSKNKKANAEVQKMLTEAGGVSGNPK